jgi:hypothetical protein
MAVVVEAEVFEPKLQMNLKMDLILVESSSAKVLMEIIF